MASAKEPKKTQAPTLTLSAGQSVETDQGITLAFATPMLRLTLPGAEFLNKGLRKRILALEEKDAGRKVSNQGGYQSKGNIFDLDMPELKILQQAIELGYRSLCQSLAPGQPELAKAKLGLNGWANINRDGHYNRTHSHAGTHWSGVYYVDAGKPDPAIADNGVLELIDPRPLAGTVPAPGFPVGHRLAIVPQPGLLTMFPAWLEHWVTPYRGTGERISLAFNVIVGPAS